MLRLSGLHIPSREVLPADYDALKLWALLIPLEFKVNTRISIHDHLLQAFGLWLSLDQ